MDFSRNPGRTEHAQQCVPGSFLSAHTQEPENKASTHSTSLWLAFSPVYSKTELWNMAL